MTDDRFEIDPVTGLPRRILFNEKRQVEKDNDKKKKQAPRVSSRTGGNVKKPQRAKKPKHSTVEDTSTGIGVIVFHETLPNGGMITLQSPEEVVYFRELKNNYEKEYSSLLSKPNDRNRLSQLISCELMAHRYTQRMLGAVNVYDDKGNISGIEKVDPVEMASISQLLPKVQDEIRRLESALKIDKRTREGSAEGDIRDYMTNLKKAAVNYKVHLSERYIAFDEFVNELSWRIRVIENADDEDRRYHNLESLDKFYEWIKDQVEELSRLDKEFAKNKQSLWLGKI